ncbi:hypothetical protein BF49_1697 [Bradyrhizobium sp.]|nr:hypothetical protein BF49_1697 [Bradyrhizobium sp.]
MLERPERRCVSRKHAENPPGRPVTFSSHQSSPATLDLAAEIARQTHSVMLPPEFLNIVA